MTLALVSLNLAQWLNHGIYCPILSIVNSVNSDIIMISHVFSQFIGPQSHNQGHLSVRNVTVRVQSVILYSGAFLIRFDIFLRFSFASYNECEQDDISVNTNDLFECFRIGRRWKVSTAAVS